MLVPKVSGILYKHVKSSNGGVRQSEFANKTVLRIYGSELLLM